MKRLLLILAVAATATATAEPKEKSVTLDVKDAEVRVILRSMQKQCGIRNLIVDPDVTGSGTFFFRDVPCDTAFRVVCRSLGLAARMEPSSVVSVENRSR